MGLVVFSRSRARLSRPTPGRDASGGPPGAPARRAASAPRGGGTLHGGGAACGSGPDPSSHRRPEGNQPGLVVSSRITRCCGAASFGLTAPDRSAWLRPPTRRGIRNLAPCGGVRRRSGIAALTPAAAGLFETDCRVLWKNVDIRRRLSLNGVVPGRCLDPTEGRFRIPRRVGGRSQSARAGGVQPDEAVPQQRVMRLDTTRPG